ncbi:MAG: CHAT domain-containing protein [Bryobacteraceae bacterium]|nr:CHAT domain-containing protein [Bryobacteraceae bacterium]
MRFVSRIAVALLSSIGWGQASPPTNPIVEADRLADLRAWTRAEPLFIQAEKVFEQAGDQRNALYAKLGRIRGELPRRSVTEVSQELSVILESPLASSDDRIRLRCLVIKGETDTDFDAALAEQDWREALEVAKRLYDPMWINRANGEIGIITALMGKTSEGVFQISTALKKAEESKDLSSVVRWLSILGTGYIQFGQYEGALKLFDRALATGSAVDELRFPVMAYLGKVSALSKLGRTKEARELLAASLVIARERESLGYQAELLRQDALLSETAGSRDEAIQKLLEALDFARRASANRIVAEIYLDLGRLQLAQGNRAGAAKSFTEGVAVARAMKERLLTPRLLAKFAESEISQGRLTEAALLLQEASEIAEGLLAGVWSPWVKSRLIGIMDEVFTARIRLELKGTGNPERIFAIVEQARGRVVTDLLMDRGQGRRAQTPAVKAGEKRIAALQFQLWSPKTPTLRAKLLDQIFRAESDMMSATVQADGARQVQGNRKLPKLNEVRQSLATNEVILEYVLDDPSSVVVGITRERAFLVRLPGRSILKRAVDEAWKNIQSGAELAPLPLLNDLLKVPDLESKTRLIIVPDADLNRLAFELLTVSSGKRLLDSHAVSYSPSVTALFVVRRKPALASSNAVLAIAASPDVTPGQSLAAFGKLDRGNYEFDGASLPALPAARAEAMMAVEALPHRGNRLLVGVEATEDAVKKLPLQEFSVAHIAAHGLLSSNFPERSALALRPEGGEDGFLQAREVLALPIRASLVTLSACNTGRGKLFGQDGVSSLVRPFLASGARAVVANLWTADDTFSLALMREFYRELAAGKQKAVALQQAKITMIRQYGSAATPKLWSGLLLFGEGSEPVLNQRREVRNAIAQ